VASFIAIVGLSSSIDKKKEAAEPTGPGGLPKQ